MIDLLTHIAEKVRNDAEHYALDNEMDSDLCGMCAIASVWLFQDLKKNGFKPILCISRNKNNTCGHVFVRVDGYDVDVTATQFDFQEVEIHHTVKRPKLWYWKPYRKFKSTKGLVNYLQFSRWSSDQMPELDN